MRKLMGIFAFITLLHSSAITPVFAQATPTPPICQTNSCHSGGTGGSPFQTQATIPPSAFSNGLTSVSGSKTPSEAASFAGFVPSCLTCYKTTPTYQTAKANHINQNLKKNIIKQASQYFMMQRAWNMYKDVLNTKNTDIQGDVAHK